MACGILVPWSRIELAPLHCKHRIITTGLPGKSPSVHLVVFFPARQPQKSWISYIAVHGWMSETCPKREPGGGHFTFLWNHHSEPSQMFKERDPPLQCLNMATVNPGSFHFSVLPVLLCSQLIASWSQNGCWRSSILSKHSNIHQKRKWSWSRISLLSPIFLLNCKIQKSA